MKQNLAAYTQILTSAVRGLYRFVLETTELRYPVWDSNAYLSMFLELRPKL